MMKASEAKKIASDIWNKSINDCLENLNFTISEAANKGNFSVYYYKDIPVEARIYLTNSLGYTLEDFSNQKEGIQFLISW